MMLVGICLTNANYVANARCGVESGLAGDEHLLTADTQRELWIQCEWRLEFDQWVK